MKVLFTSLSRIGDYIQHLAVIRAWSFENPDVEVHILVNDLIPEDLKRMNAQFQHKVLPRFEFQRRINQVSTPLLYPFWNLRKLIRDLRDEKYVQLFDLTYQNHSLAFLKLVQPGFGYSAKEVTKINEYLDASDEMHLIDKLKSIHELAISPVEALGRPASKVFFQVSTSDSKKNIDLPRWRILLDSLKIGYPGISFKVISSRQERKNHLSVFSADELLVVNFSELASVLDSETRLVSLDTSIKHFAAQFQIPTVELSVGSSHWIKNAAYQSGNFVFSADFHCRPCVHSKNCPLGRNQCQDEIDFEHLREFIGKWILDADTPIYPMRSKVKDGNLSIQRGDKWKQKIVQTNLHL